MVSRRKILSRSRDDLNLDGPPQAPQQQDEEDVWYQKEKLYRDHIQEVLNKWESIDDEIWAKVIVLERNRRVAKAYARAPVLTVNGSEDGFDGFRIGVNGFENPLRDPKTAEFKTQIGQGCKIKMDESGNILIKRFSKSAVHVKNVIEENAVSNDILKQPGGLLDLEKPFKLFDMKKFQQNVNREMKRTYPDRHKLEAQCISTVAFVKNEPELLDSPIWVMLINVVALEMLKAKMPEDETAAAVAAAAGQTMMRSKGQAATTSRHHSRHATAAANGGPSGSRPGVRHSSEPRKRFLGSGSSDEDPYSLTPSGSSGSSGKGRSGGDQSMPRLPIRDKEYYGPQNWAKNGRSPVDYSDDMEDEHKTTSGSGSGSSGAEAKNSGGVGAKLTGRSRQSRAKAEAEKRRMMEKANNSSSSSNLQLSSGDDPYYCGLRARVPNFAKSKEAGKPSTRERNNNHLGRPSNQHLQPQSHQQQGRSPLPSRSVPNLQNLAQLPGAAHPFWWHSRLYPEAGPSMADLSSYHYPGRMAGARGGGYRAAFMSPPGAGNGGAHAHAHAHQRPVFRTGGWD